MKKFKRHLESPDDLLRETLDWISRGSHLPTFLDVVIDDIFGADDCSVADCAISEDLLEIVYVLLVRSRSFSGYLNLPAMIPADLAQSFS